MKYSAVSYTLFLICLGLVSQSVQGFQSVASSTSASPSLSLSQNKFAYKVANNVALHASLIDPEQEPEKTTVMVTGSNNPSWKKLCEINDKFWDYTVNFFYVFMTVGILMNLSGFAYKVDLEDGFTVQTVKERRQELQWQKEMQRYDHEAAVSNQKSLLQKVENRQ